MLEFATHIFDRLGGERAPTQAAGLSQGDEPFLIDHSKGLPAVPRLRASRQADLPGQPPSREVGGPIQPASSKSTFR